MTGGRLASQEQLGKQRMTFMRAGIVYALLLLAGCGTPPPYVQYPGPVADPQVVYRIDANRYFELVPQQAAACVEGTLTYVDRQQGIRSTVFHWRSEDYHTVPKQGFIIDAANTQYLIGPWRRFPYGCQSGGGGCDDRLPYSIDSGRTWQFTTPASSGNALYAIGDEIYLVWYESDESFAKLSKPLTAFSDWTGANVKTHPLPPIAKAPLDNHFHCTPNGKE
jgi:hypothetical protein